MTIDLDFAQSEKASQQLLEALISSAVDAIVVIDGNGLIRLFSRSAERMFGYRHEEVVGKNISMLMPQPYRDEHDGYLHNYQKTRQKRIIGIGREVMVHTREGQEFPADLAVGEALIDGQPVYVGILRDLRKRSHLETMLKQERRRAERVFDLVDVVIVGIDDQGRVLIANRKGNQLLAGDQGPVGANWRDCIDPGDHQQVEKLLAELFENRPDSPQPGEYRILDQHGRNRVLAWQHQFVPSSETGDPDLVLCTGVDITETHHMTRLLRRREEQLRLMFDQAPVGIARLDLSGTVVAYNTPLGQLLNAENLALYDYPFQRLLDDRSQPEFETALEDLVRGTRKTHAQDCSLAWETTSIKARLSIGAICDAEGVAMNILVQIEDRSEQVAAETEINSLSQRLAHVQRLSVMGEMAAGIAHEINQPLGAIATFADGAKRVMATDPPRMEDIEYALGQIGDQARRAAEVIKRMRAMAKNKVVSRQGININQLISDLMSLAELEARNLGAPLILELTMDLPPALVDEVQIQQVILNLIRNSLEALATRSQATQGVTISTQAEDGEITVCVADHGVGVPEEFQRRVFEPFYSSKPTGTGMGLSICSTIVRAHQGRLWYEPNTGGGSQFRFTLPIA
jgi:PAS domain S-box-containing protein